MDSRIDALLEKYWNAEASIEEEKELKALVQNAGEEVPEELKGLFDHFDEKSDVVLGQDFDEEILSKIDNEQGAKVVSFNAYFRRYASVAAAVLVMVISSVMLMKQPEPKFIDQDTFETPEEALAALKQQLSMFSVAMDKGNGAISGLKSLSAADNQLNAFSKMSTAESGLNMLGELNVNN